MILRKKKHFRREKNVDCLVYMPGIVGLVGYMNGGLSRFMYFNIEPERKWNIFE